MKKYKNIEIRSIFFLLCLLFVAFLVIPIIMLFTQSLAGNEGVTLAYVQGVFQKKNIGGIFLNSIGIALLSACITTVLAFVLAYTIHFTNTHPVLKKIIKSMAVMPMLLPTITREFDS